MAEIKFSKHTVTNNSDGPRVLNAKSPMVVQAGESVEDVEISEAELASAKATEYFGFGGAAAKKAAEPKEA